MGQKGAACETLKFSFKHIKTSTHLKSGNWRLKKQKSLKDYQNSSTISVIVPPLQSCQTFPLRLEEVRCAGAYLLGISSLLNVLKHASKQREFPVWSLSGHFLFLVLACWPGIVQRSPGKTVIWDNTMSGTTSNESTRMRRPICLQSPVTSLGFIQVIALKKCCIECLRLS